MVKICIHSSSLEEKETGSVENERIRIVWPFVERCNSDSALNQSNRLKNSRGRISSSEAKVLANSNDQPCEIVKKRNLCRAASDDPTACSVRLRERRTAVSSVSPPSTSAASNNLNDSLTDMPMKKNTFKITAKFIGSLQKRANQKSKEDDVAAAVALAAMLTDPTR